MDDYDKKKVEIGARIQEIRKKRHMTQEILIEKVGIKETQQMSNIERGISGVSLP
mgnify:CR=1 FL=1